MVDRGDGERYLGMRADGGRQAEGGDRDEDGSIFPPGGWRCSRHEAVGRGRLVLLPLPVFCRGPPEPLALLADCSGSQEDAGAPRAQRTGASSRHLPNSRLQITSQTC